MLKEFLRRFVNADTASSHHFVAVLKTTTASRRTQKFATTLVATGDPVLREAKPAQAHQILRASTAVQIYANGDARVS